jgi:soluble lytic murein transglycosylase-like protein
MHTNIASLAVAAVGAALLVGAGEARAPVAPALSACMPLDEDAFSPASAAEHRALVRYLSRRYTIATEATEEIVSAAHHAAEVVGLDPLLVLAVIAVESRFNPIAQSMMGAKGLMQIIPKYHRATLGEHGGEQAVLDPRTNILVGSRILQEYVERTGSLEAGLQFYNGAFWDDSARYARRVMAERGRLEQVLRAVGST